MSSNSTSGSFTLSSAGLDAVASGGVGDRELCATAADAAIETNAALRIARGRWRVMAGLRGDRIAFSWRSRWTNNSNSKSRQDSRNEQDSTDKHQPEFGSHDSAIRQSCLQ